MFLVKNIFTGTFMDQFVIKKKHGKRTKMSEIKCPIHLIRQIHVNEKASLKKTGNMT